MFAVLGLTLTSVIRVAAAMTRCGTPQPPQDMFNMHQLQALRETNSSSNATDSPRGSTFEINTYVHIIAGGSTVAQGNIPDEAVESQMNFLNFAYQGAGFSFVLKGVTRTVNKAWRNIQISSPVEYQMKSSLHRGSYMDLNIYFDTIAPPHPESGDILGYATFPTTPVTQMVFNLDGLVLDPNTVPGGSEAPYNLGITGVHEIGHWLGLFHPFQSPYFPPPPEGGCIGPGDFVYDTPAEESAAFGCQIGRHSCAGYPTTSSVAGPDQIHNYMDYSDDACLTQFTPGQVVRIQGLYESLRLNV